MIPFSDEDLKEPVSYIIKSKIAPMLARDGGAIEFLDVIKGRIFIQLRGACIGCGASNSTLKFIVEKELKTTIHPELVIVNVPQGMENKLQEL